MLLSYRIVASSGGGRGRERERGREAERQRGREAERQRGREAERQRGREAKRQRDTETEGQRDRGTDRQRAVRGQKKLDLHPQTKQTGQAKRSERERERERDSMCGFGGVLLNSSFERCSSTDQKCRCLPLFGSRRCGQSWQFQLTPRTDHRRKLSQPTRKG